MHEERKREKLHVLSASQQPLPSVQLLQSAATSSRNCCTMCYSRASLRGSDRRDLLKAAQALHALTAPQRAQLSYGMRVMEFVHWNSRCVRAHQVQRVAWRVARVLGHTALQDRRIRLALSVCIWMIRNQAHCLVVLCSFGFWYFSSSSSSLLCSIEQHLPLVFS